MVNSIKNIVNSIKNTVNYIKNIVNSIKNTVNSNIWGIWETYKLTGIQLFGEIEKSIKIYPNTVFMDFEKCDEYWGRDYFTLDVKDPDDQGIIKKLRILVPERIIEAKIER